MHTTTATISERIRRQDAPTIPVPRISPEAAALAADVLGLAQRAFVNGRCVAEYETPMPHDEIALAVTEELVADLDDDAYGLEIAIPSLTERRAWVYQVTGESYRDVHRGTWRARDLHAVCKRVAPWCPACEQAGHALAACVDDDAHAGEVEETVAESLGGWR